MFEAGSSNIRFQSTDGQAMQPPQGFKGEKVNRIINSLRITAIANYWLANIWCEVYLKVLHGWPHTLLYSYTTSIDPLDSD